MTAAVVLPKERVFMLVSGSSTNQTCCFKSYQVSKKADPLLTCRDAAAIRPPPDSRHVDVPFTYRGREAGTCKIGAVKAGPSDRLLESRSFQRDCNIRGRPSTVVCEKRAAGNYAGAGRCASLQPMWICSLR
jgi:hypothetical protein